MPAKFVLGLNTHQLNRDYDYGDGPVNQLKQFQDWGLFSKPLPASPDKLPKLVDPDDRQHDVMPNARGPFGRSEVVARGPEELECQGWIERG